MIDLHPLLNFIMDPQFYPFALITIVHLITWSYSLKGEFVSDDLEGVQKFSERYDGGKEEKLDFYEQDVKGEKKKYKVRQFNPHIGFPGSVIRWARLNIGAKFQEIGKNKKGHSVFGSVQSPFKHHAINLVIHYANLILAYLFLSNVLDPQIALMAVLLFAIHPVSCQGVAWISAICYLLSLFWALLSLNVVFLLDNPFITVPIVMILTFLSICQLLSGMANFVIFAFLGFYWEAGGALAVSIFCFITQAMKVVNFRKDAFKKQHMGRSTYFNIRKPILMIKTFYYYMKLLFFPKRLGLYHEWGYHYTDKMERMDWTAAKGLGCLAVIGVLFYFVPELRLGLLWMTVYLALFLNVITAQQTVADRYAFISTLGFSIIIAVLLQNSLLAYGIVFGIFIMRTWVHLPTFNDEVEFYKSNAFNFPKSEVVLGNLGVVYMKNGLQGMAVDTWQVATRLNPDYDVPHYNLFSIFRQNGNFELARHHLNKCLNSSVCHFPDLWKTEHGQLANYMELIKPISPNELVQKMKEANK